MSIAITSNPATETYPRPDMRIFEEHRIEPAVLPGVTKAFIQLLEGKREHFAHIENHPATLKSDFRLFQQNFTTSPKALENDLDLVANLFPLRRGQTFMFE